MKKKPPFAIVFFKEPISGKEPARLWLKKLEKSDQRIIGHNLMTLQWNWPIGLPLVDHLIKNIWELRSTLINKEARMLFVVKQRNIIILHAFIKKTQKTPKNEIEIATNRLKELERK